MTHANGRAARRPALLAISVGLLIAALLPSPAAAATGPSTSTPSYLVPTASGVEFTSLLTVGDSVPQAGGGTYRMVGLPDGLGAFDNGDGTFTVLMNHELRNTVGVTRDHGSKGAFVSRWVIDKNTLRVREGDDLIKVVYLWDAGTNSFVAGTGVNPLAALNRLCSADLPAPAAFYNPATGLGTNARIFMNGEETSDGRAFAHVATGPAAGTSWELPWTGKYAWENHVASPFAQDKTIVVGLDDSSRLFSSEGATEPSEVYVWVGNKQATGSDIDRAGLRSGMLNGMRVGTPGNYDANESTVTSGERFELVGLTDQTNNATFAPLQSESIAKTITQFRRVEDGAFDPNNPNDFYFVTTDQFGAAGFSRLWLLRFDDITDPAAGGRIEMLIDGGGVGTSNGLGTGEMFDNIAVDDLGRVILQEDVGNQAHLGKIWAYDIATRGVLELARHDANVFLSSSAHYIGTRDEEASGVIDISSILGEGTYLLDDQVHRNISATEPELVEMGQLSIMRVGATAGFGFNAADNGSAVVVLGTSGNDHLGVAQSGDAFNVEAGQASAQLSAPAAISRIIVNGYGGNDHLDVSASQSNATLVGSNGNDHLTGGAGNDWLSGGAGNDRLIGGPGADTMLGGAGNDQFGLGAGEGDTTPDFGAGNDKAKDT